MFGDFFEAEKSDSRRGDGKPTAKKDEEVRVKLRKKKESQRHEHQRSWKKKIMTEKNRNVPQSIAPNVATLEQSLEAMLSQWTNPGVVTVEESLEAVPQQLTASNVANGERTLEAIPQTIAISVARVVPPANTHWLVGTLGVSKHSRSLHSA